ncbi:MAG TPA: amidohydrolase [Ktedonobacter sp.]|nr:amidohydrolase [Ktedonobacter sp.]
MSIDLSHISVADDHCHGIYRTQGPMDIKEWRQHFTESHDSSMRETHVATTLFYHHIVQALASFFDCEPAEETVLNARNQLSAEQLISTLLRDANLAALFVDKGYPSADSVLPDATLSYLANCRVAPMLRVELVMQDLIAQHSTLDDVIEALKTALQDVRGQGYVALKSIAAYRTGLAIRRWERDDVLASFAEARREVEAKGSVRLAHKPLLDTLLFTVFDAAAMQELPIQFHTGYGDADADMLLANPLHLRTVFETPSYRSMPIVLLHESYPYTRQGAYLATVYENAYLDISYAIPFLGYSEMLNFTRAALSVAPYSKLLYASDGVGIPELHWYSAHTGRRIIAQVLEECVADGDLRNGDVEDVASAILRDNALRLYSIEDA